tara:strand:- start:473 stop:1198 length:726 start_codon:yes stop_codon:yes gene_type:complete
MGKIVAPYGAQDSLIRIYENAYSKKYCERVIQAFEDATVTAWEKKDHVYSDVSLRKDTAVFMDKPDEGADDMDRRITISEEFFGILGVKTTMYLKDVGIWKTTAVSACNMKVQKYSYKDRGGYYKFHSEQGSQDEKFLRRMLTYTLYLNDVPEGEGETEYLFQGIRYQPKQGDLVIVPAFFTHTHRGNPVFTTDKYIATGWLLWETPKELQANFYDNPYLENKKVLGKEEKNDTPTKVEGD